METLVFLAAAFIMCAIALIIFAFLEEEPMYILGIIICILFSVLCINEIRVGSWECCNNTIMSEYCSECGKAKPIECRKWTCCDHEHNKDVKFCPDCGKAKPTDNNITNNIIVKDNENVEINVNDDSVVIIEDKWTCCNKKLENKFCPDCGKPKGDNVISESETIINN